MYKNPLQLLKDESGFMTFGGHILGAIFLALTLAAVLTLTQALTFSTILGLIVIAVLFIPIFMVTHGLADILTTSINNFLISCLIIIVLGITINVFTIRYVNKIYGKRIDSAIKIGTKIQNVFASDSQQKKTITYPSEIKNWNELVLLCKNRSVSLEADEKDQGITFEFYKTITKSNTKKDDDYLLILKVNKVPKKIKGKVLVIDSKEIKKLNKEAAEKNYSFILSSKE